mmetsp:Transcript_25119/g.63266  ORF Transcript_25119/g.63266 Transcript_25119/m.63266 type:complete len:166 (+) Transcript_25119:2153-2650(+)
MSDETRHTLQQLLRLALEAVCPAQAHLVESNAGCVKPSMKVGKVGGAGDYESRVALALYHNLAASQASGLRERSDGAEPGGVLVVSALGLLRRLSSAAELAAALLEALLGCRLAVLGSDRTTARLSAKKPSAAPSKTAICRATQASSPACRVTGHRMLENLSALN